MTTIANYPYLEKRTDAELEIYFRGYSAAMGSINPPPEVVAEAMSIAKEALGNYAKLSLEDRAELDAEVAEAI